MTATDRAEQAAAADELEVEIQAFRARFGEAPHVFGFSPESWPRLAATIREAVAKGENLSIDETYWRMGVEPPPEGALL